MMAGARDILELLSGMGVEIEANGDCLRYRPQSAITRELAWRLKCHKTALVALLRAPDTDNPDDSGSGQVVSSVAEAADSEKSRPSYADREWDRFLSVAKPTPTGGLYDPANSTPELLSGFTFEPQTQHPDIPDGWTPKSWRRHLRYMSEACERDHAGRAADFRARAKALEVVA